MRVENLHREIFDKIIFGIADQILLQRDCVIRFRVHEMIAVVIFVAEFELFSLDIDQLHFVGRAKANISAFAGVDVADDGLHEGAQISGRAMMHLEHNGGVAVVRNRHSFAEIVGCGHGRDVNSSKRRIVKIAKSERGHYLGDGAGATWRDTRRYVPNIWAPRARHPLLKEFQAREVL